jgi:hypothetical protein
MELAVKRGKARQTPGKNAVPPRTQALFPKIFFPPV